MSSTTCCVRCIACVNRQKIGDFVTMQSVCLKISGRKCCLNSLPTNHFRTVSWANQCFTTLSLTVFTQRNFVEDFPQEKCNFRQKSALLRFSAPFGGLRGNVWLSPLAHWKVHSWLPITVNWTFFTRCYRWGATSDYWFKISNFAPTGARWVIHNFV